jgi:hypothetical protein
MLCQAGRFSDVQGLLFPGGQLMTPHIIGPALFAKNDRGRLLSRIATIFPDDRVLVTVPGIHFFQQEVYLDWLDQERQARGLAPLTADQRNTERKKAVSLFVDDGSIQIRPDSDNMPLVFAADAVLQELLPASRIRFLNALDPRVHDAVKRRGECWRITPLPKSTDEMKLMIHDCRTGIEGHDIYYYSKATGTRWLTCQEFQRLGALADDELCRHLAEIHRYCTCQNDQGNPEVDFFGADPAFRSRLAAADFTATESGALRAAYRTLQEEFCRAVAPELRRDDMENVHWRRRMYAALVPYGEDVASEEELLGLGAEFFMQVEWLPGGRIDQGELILDPILEQARPASGVPQPATVDYGQARGLLFNLVREYGDLEYVNLGRVITSMARRPFPGGRRGVYLVEMKRRDSAEEILKIIRMQRWGVREHLDEGKPLLDAVLNSEEYTEYILDRRLACRQLGMNLPVQVVTRKISEIYFGKQKRYWTTRIWSPYFERDYIRGITTDMVPPSRFEDREFALRFAEHLGRAAASNIIVGRQSQAGTAIFDNGDEVLTEDPHGLPADILITDHTGAFGAFDTDIYQLAAAYAKPVNDRVAYVANRREFTDVYVGACVANFARIQQEYRDRRRSFDALFADRPRDEKGSLAYRWERVLKRLDETDLGRLEAAIRKNLC